MDVETVTTSTAIGTIFGLASFIVQRIYIRSSLLEDRKNERRHQAILEALRALAPVIARSGRDIGSGRFSTVISDMDKTMVAEAARERKVFDTAVEALFSRLTTAESDGLKAALSNMETALEDTRSFLISLLD
jgi:hypothetical protein